MDQARNIALKILYNIEQNQAYSNLALNQEITKNRKQLNEKDIGLISQIVYGVTTWKLTIDEIIKKYSKIKIKKISPWIKNILRMGIYQIIFLDKIPKSAAVNESVTLAKRYGHKASSNYVNAILRKVEKSDYEELKNEKDQIKRISLTTSMPEWIIKKLIKQKNIEEVEKICKASNEQAKISIRINTLKTSKIKLKEILKKENIEVEEAILEDFLYINKAKNIENLESFKQGLYIIQDEVAALPSIIIEPKENETILDACSSPGGKTTYMAQIMKNNGEIEAWDIHEHRTKLIEQNAKRLGITNIKTQVKNATKYDSKYKEKFDKILLDVPCLGLGVIKRKPDIKWQKNEEDIKEIKQIQKAILDTCSKYVKKGGIIIYSTCSILKEENEEIVEEFLKNNKEFQKQKIKFKNENNYFKRFLEKNSYLEVYQNEKTDGFFIAKIQRI